MQSVTDIKLRQGTASDLATVNALIETAIMTWDLPERVRRLSLPSYCYRAHELEHLTLFIAEDTTGNMMGVAAWEPAQTTDVPKGLTGLLLHGIYVSPNRHRSGIGSQLLEAAAQAGRQGQFDGLLVKANRDAQGFFVALGLQALPAENPGRDYPHRFWKNLKIR